MAKDETKVRVRLDTRQAKGELRGLVREATRTAGKVGTSIRSSVGRGLGIVGLGAGFGAGMAALRGATQSGIGDVMGEALGGIGKQISEFFLGDLNENARATRSAREETIQAFGAIAGAQNAIPPGARSFFDSIKSIRVQQERGRELFELDERFRGPSVNDLVNRIMAGFKTALLEAVDYLAEKLNPF